MVSLRELSAEGWRVLNNSVSAEHPALLSDKCHMSLLTLDKGSVYQQCQPAGPAGSSLTFSTALSKRSPRIFPLFHHSLFPAHSPCSPQCFLALSLKKKTKSSRNKTDLANRGDTVWGRAHPSKALKQDGKHRKIMKMLK